MIYNATLWHRGNGLGRRASVWRILPFSIFDKLSLTYFWDGTVVVDAEEWWIRRDCGC